MGIRIAHKMVSSNILDSIELSDEFSLAEIRVKNKKFFNKSLLEMDFRRRFGLTIVAVRRRNGDVIASPAAEEVVRENDHLLVIGNVEEVDRLDAKLNE